MAAKRYGINEATLDIIQRGLRNHGAPPEQLEVVRELAAKFPRGKQIADEVSAKWAALAGGADKAGDNRFDAGRHAEWMAEQQGTIRGRKIFAGCSEGVSRGSAGGGLRPRQLRGEQKASKLSGPPSKRSPDRVISECRRYPN